MSDKPRTLAWDWYPGSIPDNVLVDETAFVETTFSFSLYRSTRAAGVTIGRGASTYLGTMFDVGRHGEVTLGDYALVHGARIICDARIDIGDHALISWNVVLMDCYRISTDVHKRRTQLEQAATRSPRRHIEAEVEARPIRIGRNVWVGFDACILPGVSIGEGAIVGARSVVTEDVPPYTIAAGNPARFVRCIDGEQGARSPA